MRYPCRAGLFSGSLTLLAILLCAGPVQAHALGAECKPKGDRVEVEAFYDDDTSARNAHVTVLDTKGGKVADGRTDVQGRWSFPAPAPGTYRVLVDAGAGHRTTVTLTLPAPSGTTPLPKTAAAITSDSRDRAEFTRFHWLGMVLGLGSIALAALLLWLLLRRSPGKPGPASGVDLQPERGEQP